MQVGQLTFGHLGKGATLHSSTGGFITGELTSMEFSWGELFMGRMVMKGGNPADGLRLTIAGWPIVAGLLEEIEVDQ